MKLPRRLRVLFRKIAALAGPITTTTALRGCPCPAAVEVPSQPFTATIAVSGVGTLSSDPASWEAYCSATCTTATSPCTVQVKTSADHSQPIQLSCAAPEAPGLVPAQWVLMCRAACGEEQDCDIGPETAGGEPIIRCVSWWLDCVSGRRTAPPTQGATRSEPEATSDVGRVLAALAALEAESVPAFTRLKRELHALGAPRALLRKAARARRDEVRHARVVGALARRHGATPPRRSSAPLALRPLEEVALENAVEGCVRESYGAVVASIQAERAWDPALRASMRRIAADEARHAALAWAVHAWAWPRLSAGARVRTELAMRAAVEAIAANLPPAGDEAARVLGMPNDPRLIQAMREMVGVG